MSICWRQIWFQVKRMIHFIIKNRKEREIEILYCIAQGKFYLCKCIRNLFCKLMKISMEIFILLQNKTCFSFHKVIFPMLHLLACTSRSCLPMKIGSDYQEKRWAGPWLVWISEQYRDFSALMRSFHLIHLTSLGYRCLTYKIGLVKPLWLPVKPLYLIWYEPEEMIVFFLLKEDPWFKPGCSNCRSWSFTFKFWNVIFCVAFCKCKNCKSRYCVILLCCFLFKW